MKHAWKLLLLSTITVYAAQSKRGLIVINSPHLSTDLPKYLGSPLLTWVYNYSPQPPSPYPHGNLSFVPMLWAKDNANSFLSTIQSGAKYDAILSFNEPDMPRNVGGSDISVEDAVTLWNQQIQPLSVRDYKLGSPAGKPPFLPSTTNR